MSLTSFYVLLHVVANEMVSSNPEKVQELYKLSLATGNKLNNKLDTTSPGKLWGYMNAKLKWEWLNKNCLVS